MNADGNQQSDQKDVQAAQDRMRTAMTAEPPGAWQTPRTLGAWKTSGNMCTATLDLDWAHSVNIILEWDHETGPEEHEELAVILPEIMSSALDFAQKGAQLAKAMLELIAAGRVQRDGVEDELFRYKFTPAL